jgi:type II secretory pathway component PulM
MRTDGWIDRIILALSGISLILVVVYLVMSQQNRSLQAEVNQRQQFINQSIEFSRVNNALIQTIARNAVAGNDDKLRALLTQNGITINSATGAPSVKTTALPAGAAPAMPGK